MPRYDNLRRCLAKKNTEAVSLSFSDIERILGRPLPDSARRHRAWWGNTRTHSQALSWLDADWIVSRVDMIGEKVRFERRQRIPDSRGREHRDRQSAQTRGRPISPREFESLARRKVEEVLNRPMRERRVRGIPKKFDFVSSDGKCVGDAKFLTMVRGKSMPPAKFAVIAEYVWLLERTGARVKFLIFGNDRRVPEEWLRRYGHLVKGIKFYFLDHEDMKLVELN